jgi:predicted metal-dependent HD superfamily phosphohydrolase
MLKDTFIELLTKYTDNPSLQEELWTEIERGYSNKNRHYHTLSHLDNLLEQLTDLKTEIKNWDTILFSLYYHDLVYNSLKTNNEEKSAEIAEKRMSQISVPTEIIQECSNQILATKAHSPTPDNDTNLFIDADLSILGNSWEVYFRK